MSTAAPITTALPTTPQPTTPQPSAPPSSASGPAPRHSRWLAITAGLTAGLTTALAVATAAPASAQELPTGSDLQNHTSTVVDDSLEYGGYVVGSVQEFFRLPLDQAVFGSAVAGSLALCLILPTPDGTCVV